MFAQKQAPTFKLFFSLTSQPENLKTICV